MVALSNYRHPKDTPKELLLSALGLVVLAAGMGGFLVQLCSPLNIVGAVNYVAVGSMMLLTHSRRARQIGYSYVPTNIKHAVFERSLIETLSQSAPHWQLLAFFLACVTLPLCDVQGLAKQLPPCFDVHKEHSIVECLVIGDKLPLYGHGMKVSSPMNDSPEKPVDHSLVSTFTRDPFTAHVVQAGLRNINTFVVEETRKQIHSTVVSVRKTMAASTSILAWIATVGIVGGSVACWWKELLVLASQSHHERLLSWGQKFLRQGMRQLKRISHTDIDMPLIALGMISGSAAVLSTQDIIKYLGPGTQLGCVSAVATPAAAGPQVNKTQCTAAAQGTPHTAIATPSLAHTTASSDADSSLLRFLVALRCCAAYVCNTALEGVAAATVSLISSTDSDLHVNGSDSCTTYNHKQMVMICAAISVLCSRRLKGSIIQQRWVACAVFHKLWKASTVCSSKLV